MFTSQMIAGGTVKPKEIVKTFGVPMVTVKRYVKCIGTTAQGVLRIPAAPQFGVGAERTVLEQAQQLLDGARSVPKWRRN